MAKIQTLTERDTGTTIYPATTAAAVYHSDGRTAEQKAADLSAAIGKKADGFTLSPDLAMSPEGELSVTDAAKRSLLIDLWNDASGDFGRYNAETGFFELNGLTDITYEEAIAIYNLYDGGRNIRLTNRFSFESVRTLLPIKTWRDLDAVSLATAFYNSPKLEAVRFVGSSYSNINDLWLAFGGCKNLKVIYGILSVFNAPQNKMSGFVNCNALETVQIRDLKFSISFADSPLLSLASLQYLIDNAINTTAITVTVHPDVYAKLTDESNAEWNAVLTAAIDKNISFTTL
ncbi:MAG: hypothetical protein NC418_11825 [Muribaculaceae bacterium]|nr:hypothetical protein [Muribaculaceae bacterium]